MKSILFRRLGLPGLFLAGTVFGSVLTGSVIAAVPQPHMQSALTDLNRAAYQLSVAARDKAGHRARALSLTNQAIYEVKLGIAAGAM